MVVSYLKSLLAHKWYVFVAGLKTGVPVWRLIVHDWNKAAMKGLVWSLEGWLDGGKLKPFLGANRRGGAN